MPGGGPEKHRFDGLLGADFSWLGGRLVWLAELAFTLGADAESTPSQMFQQVSYSVDEFTSVYASVLYSRLIPPRSRGCGPRASPPIWDGRRSCRWAERFSQERLRRLRPAPCSGRRSPKRFNPVWRLERPIRGGDSGGVKRNRFF